MIVNLAIGELGQTGARREVKIEAETLEKVPKTTLRYDSETKPDDFTIVVSFEPTSK